MLDMYVHLSRYDTLFSSSVVAKLALLSSHTHSSSYSYQIFICSPTYLSIGIGGDILKAVSHADTLHVCRHKHVWLELYPIFFFSSLVASFPLPSHIHSTLLLVANHHMLNHIFEHCHVRSPLLML